MNPDQTDEQAEVRRVKKENLRLRGAGLFLLLLTLSLSYLVLFQLKPPDSVQGTMSLVLSLIPNLVAPLLTAIVVYRLFGRRDDELSAAGLSEVVKKNLLEMSAIGGRALATLRLASDGLVGYERVFTSKFIENMKGGDEDKLRLADHVIARVLAQRHAIFLDGGTTLFHLAKRLKDRPERIPVVTNNLPASLKLCEAHGYPCKVIQGDVERAYAAILGKEACESARAFFSEPAKADDFRPIEILIISGTRFTFQEGLYGRHDRDQEFKAELLRSAHEKKRRIVFVVEGKKLFEQVSAGGVAMSKVQEWQELLRSPTVEVFVSKLPHSDSQDRHKQYGDQCAILRGAGIKVTEV